MLYAVVAAAACTAFVSSLFSLSLLRLLLLLLLLFLLLLLLLFLLVVLLLFSLLFYLVLFLLIFDAVVVPFMSVFSKAGEFKFIASPITGRSRGLQGHASRTVLFPITNNSVK